MRVYLDTNIILAIVKGERYRGLDVRQVFSKLKKCVGEGNVTLITSTWLLDEIKNTFPQKLVKVQRFLRELGVHLVPYTKEDRYRASKLDEANPTDALHAVLAVRYRADLLLTNDVKHFVLAPIGTFLSSHGVKVADVTQIYAFCD